MGNEFNEALRYVELVGDSHRKLKIIGSYIFNGNTKFIGIMNKYTEVIFFRPDEIARIITLDEFLAS